MGFPVADWIPFARRFARSRDWGLDTDELEGSILERFAVEAPACVEHATIVAKWTRADMMRAKLGRPDGGRRRRVVPVSLDHPDVRPPGAPDFHIDDACDRIDAQRSNAQLALERLSNVERFVLLQLADGVSQRDIGGLLGVTEARVSQLAGRARDRAQTRFVSRLR